MHLDDEALRGKAIAQEPGEGFQGARAGDCCLVVGVAVRKVAQRRRCTCAGQSQAPLSLL